MLNLLYRFWKNDALKAVARKEGSAWNFGHFPLHLNMLDGVTVRKLIQLQGGNLRREDDLLNRRACKRAHAKAGQALRQGKLRNRFAAVKHTSADFRKHRVCKHLAAGKGSVANRL